MASSPSSSAKPSISNAPSEKPASVPTSRNLPQKPLLSSGAYSAMKVAAPPYSPPVENPCTSRKTMSRIGAHPPMLSYDGTSPMQSVAPAIINMVSASRSEEHKSELQSLMRISYAVFCLKKKNKYTTVSEI